MDKGYRMSTIDEKTRLISYSTNVGLCSLYMKTRVNRMEAPQK